VPECSNTPLVPLAWQPVPGAPRANIYPLIRKIDTISSNSYIIESPEIICLIDPGGLPEQAVQLIAEIQRLRNVHKRPVVIFLTHAHTDHFLSLQHHPATAYFKDAVIAVQEAGANALERGDKFLTQADVLGFTVSPMYIGLRLLPVQNPASRSSTVLYREENGAAITITRHPPEAGIGLFYEELAFGGDPLITVYHTPGHSPDSITLRVGRLLFIGDVLFAANPGIAGLIGWDQKALIHSLAGIRHLTGSGDFDWICPGHGRLIAAPDAVRTFEVLEKEAGKLENIAEFNSARAAEIAALGDDCMEQVNELFTIISGRLGYVSYMMDELGESGVADEMSGLLKAEVIDELLDAFRIFSEDHHSSDKVPVYLALKAGQVMGKLERSFAKNDLARIIDPTLVSRAGHLLSEYTTSLRGFCPPDNRCECDVSNILSTLVQDLSRSRCSDEDVLSAVDDETAFTRMLVSRIGSQPLLADIDLSLAFDPAPQPVLVDRDIFPDLVIYLLEDLVGTGATKINLTTEHDESGTTVKIDGDTGSFVFSGDVPVKGFLIRLARRAGCILTGENTVGRRTYSMKFVRD